VFLLRPTRPCLTCGAPIPIERMPTALLPVLGWRPYQVSGLRPPCGHVHAAVAYPAAGVPGWWTFLPLVGTGPRIPLRPATACAVRPDGLDFWAAAPGEGAFIEQDADLQAIMATMQAELGHIRSLSDAEACRLCGVRAPLTEEHAPSRAAGNAGVIFGGRIDDAASSAAGRVIWTNDDPVPDGATFKTLCASCNNNTGGRYNPAYVALVKAAEPSARPETAGTMCQVTVVNPALVAKQALTSLVATSQPGLTTRYPHLRDLLERSHLRAHLAPLRLWCHLVANPGAWYTGIAATVNREQRAGHLVASFAFWPLGWLLTTDDSATVEGAADVSNWLEIEKRPTPVTVALPCQWRVTPYPIDFRSPDEVRRGAWPGHQGRVHLT
jgi:hypothetical protein